MVEVSSVVHVMVADVDVIAVAVTLLTTVAGCDGAVPVVLKVKLAEVDETPDPLVYTTCKLYVVPGMRPVSGTT